MMKAYSSVPGILMRRFVIPFSVAGSVAFGPAAAAQLPGLISQLISEAEAKAGHYPSDAGFITSLTFLPAILLVESDELHAYHHCFWPVA